jgi:pantoate--beta-alanine ligase
MHVLKTVEEMRAASRALRQLGQRLALVPTMGALHAGHLSLIRLARERADAVAASIFVNPLQFSPEEDLLRYPRNFPRDRDLLENEGVELLFAPSVEDMYPEPPATLVTVEGLTEALCGRSRPGHFRGVATVVAKLFAIVAPDLACFGQKDAAQLAVIRRMVRDLDIPVEIVAGPIVREADGLAMSSRNAYLTPQERAAAPALFRSLERVRALYEDGERRSGPLVAAGTRPLEEEPRLRLDYFEIVDPDSLLARERIEDRALVAVAAFLGTTRLIDNLLLGAQPGLARETN